MKTINYYSFDSIEKDEYGCCWATYQNETFEVFYQSADESESEMLENGFAKCDATNWNETMWVEESSFSKSNLTKTV